MTPPHVRILSVAHDVADARLARIVDALVRHGRVRVTLEGRGDAARGPDGATVVTQPGQGALARARRALLRPFAVGADVLVVVDPDLVPTARLATWLRGSALVVDVHEDYRAVARDRPWARGLVGALARAVVGLVLAVAARADLVTVADDHVPPRTARRRLVVRNQPVLGALPDAGEPGPVPRAVYVGDLRPSRGLHTMIDAVAGTEDWQLDLVGALGEVDEEALRRSLAERGLADRVRLHGRLPLEEAWSVARGAWVGLCMLDPTPAYVAAMPTKVLEYLAVGLPVLATPLPRVRSLLAEAGAGVCVDGPDEAAATLLQWSAEPAHIASLHAGTRRWATEHLRGPSPFDQMAAAILTLPEDEHAQ